MWRWLLRRAHWGSEGTRRRGGVDMGNVVNLDDHRPVEKGLLIGEGLSVLAERVRDLYLALRKVDTAEPADMVAVLKEIETRFARCHQVAECLRLIAERP